LDISGLRGFGATDEQQVNNFGPPRVIDSVTRTEVYAHFRDTASQDPSVAKVPFGGTVKAIQDDGFGPNILHFLNPGTEFVGLEKRVHG
jgi:hypothetical protein